MVELRYRLRRMRYWPRRMRSRLRRMRYRLGRYGWTAAGMLVAVIAGAAFAATRLEPAAGTGGASRAPAADCPSQPCVDSRALDGRINVFVSQRDFEALARRWCGLRAGAGREAVRQAILRTKGVIAEWGEPVAHRDAWNVAVSQGGVMAQGAPVDVRLVASYGGGGRVSVLSYDRRANGPVLPCAARRS